MADTYQSSQTNVKESTKDGRVIIDKENGFIKIYDSSNNEIQRIGNGQVNIYDTSGVELLRIDGGFIIIFDDSGNTVMRIGYITDDGSANPVYGVGVSDGTNWRVLLGKQTNGF